MRECPTCGDEFGTRRGLGVHHSSVHGERLPNRECDRCGDQFERTPGNVDSERVFCSPDCQNDWLSEAFTSEGHPNWKGGSGFSYGPGWNEVRRKALERDDHECVLCGTDREDLGRNPDVHHITPVRAFAASPEHDVADAHYLANVVTLCPRCHRWAEFGSVDETTLRGGAEIGPDRACGGRSPVNSR